MLTLIFGWLAGGVLLGLLLAISTYDHNPPHRPTLQARIAYACVTVWILGGAAALIVGWLR